MSDTVKIHDIPLVPISYGETGRAMLATWKRVQKSNRRVIPFEMDIPPSAKYRHHLHHHGMLQALAFSELDIGPIAVCDTDWFPLAFMDFERFLDSPISMCRDVWPRRYSVLENVEHNAGIMVITQDVFDAYMDVWKSAAFQSECSHIPWAGEICITRVWELLGGSLMPDAWNASRALDNPAAHAQSIHFHGAKGKQQMAEWLRKVGA